MEVDVTTLDIKIYLGIDRGRRGERTEAKQREGKRSAYAGGGVCPGGGTKVVMGIGKWMRELHRLVAGVPPRCRARRTLSALQAALEIPENKRVDNDVRRLMFFMVTSVKSLRIWKSAKGEAYLDHGKERSFLYSKHKTC